jgi:5-methylcytosine-specific restriction endonuclease McrA
MSKTRAHNRERLRRALAARDGLACFYCQSPFPALEDATLDHLIPQSLLPGWQQFNLVLACLDCNEAKGDQLPQVFLRSLAARRSSWLAHLTTACSSAVSSPLTEVGG